MAAGKLDFLIEQGGTFRPVLTWNADGSRVDLTGWTARMQIRDDYSSEDFLFELTTENSKITLGGTLGTISLLLSAEETATIAIPPNIASPDLPPQKILVYDLEMINGSVVTRLVYGQITVSGEVTRDA